MASQAPLRSVLRPVILPVGHPAAVRSGAGYLFSGELTAGEAPSAGYTGFDGAWVEHNWDDGEPFGSIDPESLADNIAFLGDGTGVDAWLVLRPDFVTAHGAGVEYDITVAEIPGGEPLTLRFAPFDGWGNIDDGSHVNGPYSLWRHESEPFGFESGKTYSFTIAEVVEE